LGRQGLTKFDFEFKSDQAEDGVQIVQVGEELPDLNPGKIPTEEQSVGLGQSMSQILNVLQVRVVLP